MKIGVIRQSHKFDDPVKLHRLSWKRKQKNHQSQSPEPSIVICLFFRFHFRLVFILKEVYPRQMLVDMRSFQSLQVPEDVTVGS